MADRLTPEERSRNMARIQGKNTRPEMILRSLLHKAGFRFRLHERKLPGKPDIVLPRYKTVIFVNGCYWHRHQNCPKATIPKTRSAFWLAKFQATVERDRHKKQELQDLGWNVLTVWECELDKNAQSVLDDLRNQLMEYGHE